MTLGFIRVHSLPAQWLGMNFHSGINATAGGTLQIILNTNDDNIEIIYLNRQLSSSGVAAVHDHIYKVTSSSAL